MESQGYYLDPADVSPEDDHSAMRRSNANHLGLTKHGLNLY